MKVLATNKKAHFLYILGKKYTAGIMLSGQETKSVRNGGGNTKGAYVIFKKGEAYLLGLHIRKYKHATVTDYDPDRTRKLLLNKSEIKKMEQYSVQKGNSLVLTRLVETDRGLVKVEIAEARGKKLFEKKKAKKERDISREIAKSHRY